MEISSKSRGCRNRALLELIGGTLLIAVVVFIIGGLAGAILQVVIAEREDALNLACGSILFVVGSLVAWWLWKRLQTSQK
jgi:4-amino-4-deoxy-L-arabinose transferase-like glycosyltransferase